MAPPPPALLDLPLNSRVVRTSNSQNLIRKTGHVFLARENAGEVKVDCHQGFTKSPLLEQTVSW